MTRLLSVLTPALSSTPAEYLQQAQQSVVDLQLPDGWELEWIVHQDGPGEIALEPNSGIRLSVARNEPDHPLGAATTRTAALMRSRGDLVISLDADDYFITDGLISQIIALEKHPECQWASGQSRHIIEGQERPRPCPLAPGIIPPGGVSEAWRQNGCRRIPIPTTPVLFRRPILMRAGGWPALARGADISLVFAISDNYPGFLTDQDFYAYRKWPGQLTHAISDNQITREIVRRHRREWGRAFGKH